MFDQTYVAGNSLGDRMAPGIFRIDIEHLGRPVGSLFRSKLISSGGESRWLRISGDRGRSTKNFMAKVKHTALIKFKDGTSQDQIEQLFQEVMDMTENIPGIEDYVWGENSSPEGLNQGFTHGFIMTFTDTASRDAYLPHPEHERIKGALLPHIDSLVVFDFEV